MFVMRRCCVIFLETDLDGYVRSDQDGDCQGFWLTR